MKTLTAYSVLLMAILWMCPQTVIHAQSGPTLDETIQYLTKKLKSAGTTIYYNVDMPQAHIQDTISYEVAGFNNGVLSINLYKRVDADADSVPSDHSSTIISLDIPLSLMSPEIKVTHRVNRLGPLDYYAITIQSSGSAPIAYQERKTQDSTGQTSQNSGTQAKWDIAITNVDDANRIASALQHAIELCGGKKELFDSTPPQ